jgi:excisionase family DNA binding protein
MNKSQHASKVNQPDIPIYISRREVAEKIGVHTETIKRATKRGELPVEKFNSRLLRYRLSDVNAWIERARV